MPLFSRKFPEKFRRKFPEISELTTLITTHETIVTLWMYFSSAISTLPELPIVMLQWLTQQTAAILLSNRKWYPVPFVRHWNHPQSEITRCYSLHIRIPPNLHVSYYCTYYCTVCHFFQFKVLTCIISIFGPFRCILISVSFCRDVSISQFQFRYDINISWVMRCLNHSKSAIIYFYMFICIIFGSMHHNSQGKRNNTNYTTSAIVCIKKVTKIPQKVRIRFS